MSEIGNKALLRARAERLQILDQRVYPQQLATDRVIPVQEVDPLPPPPQLGTFSIEEQETSAYPLLGLSTLNLQIYQTGDWWAKTLGLGFSVYSPVDPAPSAFRLAVLIAQSSTPLSQVPVVDLDEAGYTPPSAPWTSRFALGGYTYYAGSSRSNHAAWTWDGLVPPNSVLYMLLTRASGAFVAGSLLDWKWLGVRWPVGSVRPF